MLTLFSTSRQLRHELHSRISAIRENAIRSVVPSPPAKAAFLRESYETRLRVEEKGILHHSRKPFIGLLIALF